MGDKIMTAFIDFIGWPLAISMLSLAVIVAAIMAAPLLRLFKPQIDNYVNRRGVNEDRILEKTAPQKGQGPAMSERVMQAMSIGKLRVISEQEAAIKRDLESKELESPENKIEVLIHHLAAISVYRHFEYIYRIINGSEINLLKLANGFLMPESDVLKYFEDVKKKYHGHYGESTLEEYLRFLLNNDLIMRQKDGYTTSVKGSDFLAWLAMAGYTEYKSL